MEIKKLEWDSQFFGFLVGDVFLEKDFSESKVFYFDYFSFIQIRSRNSFEIISATHSLCYTETKTIFSKILKESNSLDEGVVDFDDSPLSDNSLYDLAYESGKFSRYRLDKKFSEERFKKLYQIWIENSINKSFADKIFYIREKEAILGFITVKINDNVAQIGLIAVLLQAQGKGLGKKLLLKTENYCLENNIKTIQIPTQLENIAACKFYEKRGYQISEKIIVKHYWKNNLK